MRVSATTSARETPRRSRAAANVLPRLDSLSAPAFDGSADDERAAPAPSVLIAAEGLVSPPGLSWLLAASVPSRDLGPGLVSFPDLISLPEFTVSSVSRTAAIHRPPRRINVGRARRRPSDKRTTQETYN